MQATMRFPMRSGGLIGVLLLVLWTAPEPVDSGSIMFYMPTCSKSMKITFMPLVNELASRGHEVVVMLPFATDSGKNRPSVKEIVLENSLFLNLTAQMSGEKLQQQSSGAILIFELIEAISQDQDRALRHPEIRGMLAGGKKFDLFVTVPFLATEAAYYLAQKFGNAELVLYFTGQASVPWLNHAAGQPHNPAYMVSVFLDYPQQMSLAQRAVNTAVTLFADLFRNLVAVRKSYAVLNKNFPEARGEFPDLSELERNASLILAFGHPLLEDGWRPKSPNFVDVGMMNCQRQMGARKGHEAPVQRTGDGFRDDPELAMFLDGAGNGGVIYMSMGSVLQSSMMSDERRQVLLKVFRKMGSIQDIRVLWKWETEHMGDETLPPNVLLRKWLPQQDVLAHPKVRLFISHAGQSSFQETLCHSKPAVFLPVFGDQFGNAKEAERQGFGLTIPFKDLSEEKLEAAIMAALNDPKYSQVAKDLGSALIDQKEHPLERAVWWMEFVMRHKGLFRGKSPVHKLAWYQFFVLDVAVVWFAVAGLSLWVAALVVRTVARWCLRHRSSPSRAAKGIRQSQASQSTRMKRE